MKLSRRNRSSRPYRSGESLDRRVDQWLETGRQFVDGVAGNRPGTRKSAKIDRPSSSNFESVGKWFGEKMDWLLEEEEDWLEPWQKESQQLEDDAMELRSGAGKRPLKAISRRKSANKIDSTIDRSRQFISEDWPDDSEFKVQRWKRDIPDLINRKDESLDMQTLKPDKRPLPRSTRRRL